MHLNRPIWVNGSLTRTQQTAKIAANCIRSLLLQSAPTAADLTMSRYLFPRLIAFVVDTGTEDPEQARALVAHTLSQHAGLVGPDRVSAAMALVIPTLMARATAEGEEVYSETSERLLELAASDQGTFRAIVGSLSGGQKSFLEEVIRSGRQTVGGPDTAPTAAAGQPSITLKLNFGG